MVIEPRRDPAVFEFGRCCSSLSCEAQLSHDSLSWYQRPCCHVHRGSAVRMTGVCGVGEADQLSACVWRVDGGADDSKNDPEAKPDYHIEF